MVSDTYQVQNILQQIHNKKIEPVITFIFLYAVNVLIGCICIGEKYLFINCVNNCINCKYTHISTIVVYITKFSV